jgi:bifunctional DNA-binding transcriptional regulator/antitoxin component of YhaV-PrlF toxin-antitoxin module
MDIVAISSRYQITIPKEIRGRFDIKPGNWALFIPHGMEFSCMLESKP